MNSSIIDILIRPDAFFQKTLSETRSLKIPLLIVLAGSIVGAGYGYLIGDLTAKMMAPAMPGIETIITLSSVAGAVLGTFLFWILWSVIMFGLTFLFKGEGQFKETVAVVGYGYLPQVIGSLISLVVAMEYVPRIVVPRISSAAFEDPALLEQSMKAFMHDPAMLEMTQITSLITIVFLLWSANIWIFGIRHARRIAPRDAALCVGIPIILYVIYLIYSLGAM